MMMVQGSDMREYAASRCRRRNEAGIDDKEGRRKVNGTEG